jgi:hypothetical protein
MFWLNKEKTMHTKHLVLQLKTLGFDPITWEEGNSDLDGEIWVSEFVKIEVPAISGSLFVWRDKGNNEFYISHPIKNLVDLKHELHSALKSQFFH